MHRMPNQESVTIYLSTRRMASIGKFIASWLYAHENGSISTITPTLLFGYMIIYSDAMTFSLLYPIIAITRSWMMARTTG